jgi:hypothetical protein
MPTLDWMMEQAHEIEGTYTDWRKIMNKDDDKFQVGVIIERSNGALYKVIMTVRDGDGILEKIILKGETHGDEDAFSPSLARYHLGAGNWKIVEK